MVAIIPIVQTDELVMVSDGGQIIRMPVEGISFTGRTARGVTLFRVSEGERVVSVSRIRDVDEVEECNELQSNNLSNENKNSTITVNVGSTVAGNHTHRFASATTNAITAGGNHTHTFEHFKNNTLHKHNEKPTFYVLEVDEKWYRIA